jgi:hypothetical protein
MRLQAACIRFFGGYMPHVAPKTLHAACGRIYPHVAVSNTGSVTQLVCPENSMQLGK